MLAGCIAGDAVAWRAFVRATAGLLHAAVRRAAERHGLVEIDDLVQDVYVRLLREECRLLRTFDASRASLATWLTLISRTVVHERAKRGAGRPTPQPLHDESMSSARHTERDRHERRGDLPDLPWAALSRQQQEVLQLLFQENLSVEQAAARLGVDPQTVRSAKHKALTRLRDEMRAGGDGAACAPTQDSRRLSGDEASPDTLPLHRRKKDDRDATGSPRLR